MTTWNCVIVNGNLIFYRIIFSYLFSDSFYNLTGQCRSFLCRATKGIFSMIDITRGKTADNMSSKHLNHIKTYIFCCLRCLCKMINNFFHSFQRHVCYIFLNMIIFKRAHFFSCCSRFCQSKILLHIIIP